MINKKAFTLIELLAVIIILAVIALITVPIILRVIDDAKYKAAEASAYYYLDAVKLRIAEDIINEKEKLNIPQDGILEIGVDDIELNKIKVSGKAPEYIYLNIENKRVLNAAFCINGYNIEYKDNKASKSKTDYCRFSIVKDLIIKTTTSKLKVGTSLQLEYEINPKNITPQFTSSDDSIATIDQKGLIIPKKNGEVTITISAGTFIKTIKFIVEEDIIVSNDSLISYVKTKNFNDNSIETIEINGEIYTAHIYTFDGNQTWNDDKIFGDENDVGNATELAKNMIIVKVNGDLTINKNVTTYNTTYGGPKGFLLYVTGKLTNNGTISMTQRGAKAKGQDVYLWKNQNGTYEYVPSSGASAGASVFAPANSTLSGKAGSNGTNRATGGGGSGAANAGRSGSGGIGTSYSGGTGGGGAGYDNVTASSGDNSGGKGGNGVRSRTEASGGAGNPGGANGGTNGTGGLLIIYTSTLDNKGSITADGIKGGSGWPQGGSSGGGSINIFANLIETSGTIHANGGAISGIGGAGGNGSVTIGSIVDGNFVKSINDYGYTGKEETYKIPATGYYKLETWGAQGGTANSSYKGGYGGYSTGIVHLEKDETLYINVGGQGTNGVNNSRTGGYNGGGTGQSAYSGAYYASGGGATSIATKTGLLSTLSDDIDSILIVAGGGGGSWYQTQGFTILQAGGSGGGYIGGSPSGRIATSANTITTGGTQETGGKLGSYNTKVNTVSGRFGQGGHRNSNCGSGGGGGYYGGGGANCTAGAGGSGYINNSLTDKVMYCYGCNTNEEASLKTISTTNVSSSPISMYAKSGHGYVKITYLDS